MKSITLTIQALLTILLLTTVTCLKAQNLEHTIYPKKFKADVPGKILLKENNTVYFLTTAISGTTASESIYLNSLSKDGTLKSKKVKFPKSATGAKEDRATFCAFNGKVMAFVEGVDKSNDTRDFYAVEFDKTTLVVNPEARKLVSSDKMKRGLFSDQRYSILVSPDTKKLAVVLRANSKKDYTDFQCTLFNENLDKGTPVDLPTELASEFYASMLFIGSDYLLASYDIYNSSIFDNISRVYLSNQGELIFAIDGKDSKKHQIAIADKNKVKYVELNSGDKNLDQIFCQRVGDDLFIKSDIKNSEGEKTGMYVAKFNLDSKEVEFEHSDMYSAEFQKELKDRNVAITRGIDKTITLGVIHSESGLTYVFDQYIWTDRSSSDNSITYHTGNLIISCINKEGKLAYRQLLLKGGTSALFDRLAFIPAVKGDKLYVFFQDHEENLNTWTTGTIKIPSLRNNCVLSVAVFDASGKQSRINSNIYDQKSRLFIRTDHSKFINDDKVLLMLFNRNNSEGTFVEVKIK